MDERTADHIERSEAYRWGKYRGIVAERDDPEKLGRLRLRVPSLFGDALTGWAWPAVSFAGAGTGIVFVPAVDDLVWVEFVEGDPDQPVWTAGAWAAPGGKAEVPEEALTDYPDRMIIRTRAGHVIELSDVDGAERVVVRCAGGPVVTLDATGVHLEAEKNVEVKAGSVTVTADSIELSDGGRVQPLATRAFVENLFDKHTHGSGVGPTGTPLPPCLSTVPQVVPLFTAKVKAE